MRRMKTEWELVNHGEVQDNGSVSFDHDFLLTEGDYLIYFDDMNNSRAGQGFLMITQDVINTAKEWDDFLINIPLEHNIIISFEFDSKILFWNTIRDVAAGDVIDSGVVYIYKKS